MKSLAVLSLAALAFSVPAFSQKKEEIQVIQQVIGRDVPIAGYYSYAQIGDRLGGQVPFHNGSLLIWLLAE